MRIRGEASAVMDAGAVGIERGEWGRASSNASGRRNRSREKRGRHCAIRRSRVTLATIEAAAIDHRQRVAIDDRLRRGRAGRAASHVAARPGHDRAGPAGRPRARLMPHSEARRMFHAVDAGPARHHDRDQPLRKDQRRKSRSRSGAASFFQIVEALRDPALEQDRGDYHRGRPAGRAPPRPRPRSSRAPFRPGPLLEAVSCGDARKFYQGLADRPFCGP